jgi:hypothetical protein
MGQTRRVMRECSVTPERAKPQSRSGRPSIRIERRARLTQRVSDKGVYGKFSEVFEKSKTALFARPE